MTLSADDTNQDAVMSDAFTFMVISQQWETGASVNGFTEVGYE